MTVIAVAGGTGGVGRTIVEAILATGKHEVMILGRKPSPTLQQELGVPVIGVDYFNVEALTKVLEDNKVHTVISGLNMFPNEGRPPEIELIHAAEASKTTKRIVSSDWGIPFDEKKDGDRFPSVLPRLHAQAELRKTKNLEYTIFYNGFFLDYWCMPAVKSHMNPLTVVLDISQNTGGIPGSGNEPAVFTHSTDVARFVAASLDLEKWEPVSYVIGDKVTWNEFLALAEAAKGAKFNVTYDGVDKLKSGQVTELPGHIAAYQVLPRTVAQKLFVAFSSWFADGSLDLNPDKPLNEVFPDTKTMKVKEVLEAAWKGN